MKKLFTLACVLFGLTATVNAADIDDLKVLKHSYVLVCDDWTNDGTERPGKGNLFGDDYFLDVTGGSVATNKGSVDIGVADGDIITDEMVAKYGEDYGGVSHYNCLRLKQKQDIIAMKVTRGSKLIFIYQHGGNTTRFPLFATKADLSDATDLVQGTDHRSTDANYKNYGRMEWTAPDDMTLYVGDNGGDMWVSFIIYEANEIAGSPSVKKTKQEQDANGLWYVDVTCKAQDADRNGTAVPTVVTYTTDGSDPTATSPLYKDAIRCYNNQVVKFQAFMDLLGDGTVNESYMIPNADNEAAVNFKFDAPTISDDGKGGVTIKSKYDGAINYYSYITGFGADTIKNVKADAIALTESATVSAYSEIVNGEYATFTSNSTSKDVYVLNPLTETKTIQITEGTVVRDYEEEAKSEEAGTLKSGQEIYKVEGGKISADKMDFFVKNLEFGTVTSGNPDYRNYKDYQIEHDERYIKMNNTNITFQVTDSVDVRVICSLNSCKTYNEIGNEDVTTDRQCAVNVNGTAYYEKKTIEEEVDGEIKETETYVPVDEGGYIIEFGLSGGDDKESLKTYTFQKYSGTGNILVYSIEIAPAGKLSDVSDLVTGVEKPATIENANAKTMKVLKDGRLIIVKGGIEYNVLGVQVK